MGQLQTRDLEILRTLARLHFVTSGELNSTFFSSEKAGWRRLRRMAQLDLIKRHVQGVPERLHYCAWRLTGRGIARLLDEFPREPLLEGLDERLRSQSLADV